MKAVIMAGGEGSRLRPLTCDLPKPMARLCGRPVIEYILELLSLHGFSDVSVTTRYLPLVLEEHFSGGRYKDINLTFVREDVPLGTAGSVKNAAGSEESVLVISGDALCDFDLTAAIAFHCERKADVTIIAKSVEDPREYGLIACDERDKVTGFIEKPGWNQVCTNLANTGVYIVNKNCLDLVPARQSFDFAKDLFPLMLKRSMRIMAHKTKGYWCDIGDMKTYLSCQQDLLGGKTAFALPGSAGLFGAPPPVGKYTVTPPVYFGQNVKVANGAQIGPDTVLDDGCAVGAQSKIRQSVLLPRSAVGANSHLTGAVLCADALVKENAHLFEGSVGGTGAVIGRDAKVLSNVKIWPGKTAADGESVREHLKYGATPPLSFDDDGLCGQAGVELTPQFCVRLGCALGSLKTGERIGVAACGGNVADALKSALCTGLISAGSTVFDFGACTLSAARFDMIFCDLPLLAYVQSRLDGETATVSLLGEGGLPLPRFVERELEHLLARDETRRAPLGEWQNVTDLSGMKAVYRQNLLRLASGGLAGVAAVPACEDAGLHAFFAALLKTLRADTETGPTFQLSKDGQSLCVFDEQTGVVPHERLLALAAKIHLQNGHDLALPADAPAAIEEMAQPFEGRRVLRYLNAPADNSDQPARALAAGQHFMHDGAALAVMLLDHLREQNVTLAGALAEIPQFTVLSKVIPLHQNPAEVMKMLGEQMASPGVSPPGEGLKIEAGKACAHVCPSKKGGDLKLKIEAANAEIAGELFAEIAHLVGD